MPVLVPTLPLPPGVNINVGSTVTKTARVLKAQFGNSYAQRVGDGYNSVTAQYKVSFAPLWRSESQVLMDFFEERAGWQSFYFTRPGDDVALMWTCETWSLQHVDGLIDNVSATFDQVFTPGS